MDEDNGWEGVRAEGGVGTGWKGVMGGKEKQF